MYCRSNFNGFNFSHRNKQVLFHLDFMDIDIAIVEEKLVAITNFSNNKQEAIIKLGKDHTDSV